MRVVGPRPRNPRRGHVAVADRLDLLDLVAVDEFVKCREQTIEHPDDLARVESARKRSEVDDWCSSPAVNGRLYPNSHWSMSSFLPRCSPVGTAKSGSRMPPSALP